MFICEEKIFCLGLSRTGTTSTGDALVLLGYKRFGWTPGFCASQILRWHEGLLTDKAISIINQYDAFEDLPWPLYFDKLDALCPNAKFILTTRKDTDTWLNSIQRHVSRLPKWVGCYLVYGSYDPIRDSELYREKYETHNESVRKYFSPHPERILEVCYERNDGWEKICHFLKRDIPKENFPHSNAYRKI